MQYNSNISQNFQESVTSIVDTFNVEFVVVFNHHIRKMIDLYMM